MSRWSTADINRVASNVRARIADPLGGPDKSEPEALLDWQLKSAAAPVYERQFRVTPERKFLIDFYFPKGRLAVEVDGGGWINGRHSRGSGIERDAEKSALIARMPARLIRVTPKQIKDGRALDWILKALQH